MNPRYSTLLTYVLAALFGLFVATYTQCVHPGFYYHDDVLHQYLPVFQDIGHRLLKGEYPVISSRSWMAGNYIGEYQFGLLNPICLLLSVAVSQIDSFGWGAYVFAATFFSILAAGTCYLALQSGLSRRWALLVAVTMASNPYVQYWMASAWLTSLIALAFVPWALGAMFGRVMSRGQLAVLIIATYLTATAGFPYMVILLVVAALVRAALTFREERTECLLMGGALFAGLLLAMPALWPLHELQQLSIRENEISSYNFLTPTLDNLLSFSLPWAKSPLALFSGFHTILVPYFFAGVWLLAALSSWKSSISRSVKLILGLGAILLVMTLGPQQLGPFRWPVRWLPEFHLALLLLAALVAQEGKFNWRIYVGLGAALLVLSWCKYPSFVVLGVNAFALAVVALCWRHTQRGPLLAAATAVIFCITTWMYPANTEIGGVDIHAKGQQEWSRCTDYLVGNTTLLLRSTEVRITDACPMPSGNMALVNQAAGPMINGYSSLPRRGVAAISQGNIFGWVMQGMLPLLSAVQPKLGVNELDLMGITQLIVETKDSPIPPATLNELGFKKMASSVQTQLWRRPQSSLSGSGFNYVCPTTQISQPFVGNDEDTKYSLTTNEANCLLVFNRPWFPGYKLNVDGQPFALIPINQLYVATILPKPGPHQLELIFEIPGKIIWLPALVIGLLLAIATLWGRPKGR